MPFQQRDSRAQDALPMATPRALGPTLPPELQEYAADWPAPRQSLAAHRAATSTISQATVANLAEAWQVPLPVSGGATVANDLVFGAGLDGLVRAFAATTGDDVWQWQAPVAGNAPLGIAGDLLLVPAVGPCFPATDIPPGQGAIIALRLGGMAATPAATPVE